MPRDVDVPGEGERLADGPWLRSAGRMELRLAVSKVSLASIRQDLDAKA